LYCYTQITQLFLDFVQLLIFSVEASNTMADAWSSCILKLGGRKMVQMQNLAKMNKNYLKQRLDQHAKHIGYPNTIFVSHVKQLGLSGNRLCLTCDKNFRQTILRGFCITCDTSGFFVQIAPQGRRGGSKTGNKCFYVLRWVFPLKKLLVVFGTFRKFLGCFLG